MIISHLIFNCNQFNKSCHVLVLIVLSQLYLSIVFALKWQRIVFDIVWCIARKLISLDEFIHFLAMMVGNNISSKNWFWCLLFSAGTLDEQIYIDGHFCRYINGIHTISILIKLLFVCLSVSMSVIIFPY